ncbi:MAG: AAA family ATPase [Ruminococcus sp.]|nr:AAA family ATPase [Ruminococcus sp.]
MKNIPKIVLTGGPSGGKSHALKMLKIKLDACGIKVFIVTEAATGLLNDGYSRESSGYDFQLAIARYQLEKEHEAQQKAPKENAVIICDRGLMDSRVYLDDADFLRFKSELGMSEVDLRDSYDAVFHLDSTAVDENTDYKNNEVRDESRNEAKDINERSLRAWCGNPHYRVIPVCDSVDEKLDILLKEVKAFLGIPKPLEIERKFLIEYPDTDYLMSLVCSKCEIEQSYMLGPEGKFRLRKRGENGSYVYIKTVKTKISDTIREEVETRLTEDEYNELLKNNACTGSIKKDRYCLMYNSTYFEIDIFPFWKKQAYLEVELLSEDDEIKLPDFIKVIREVTYDSRYKNSSLCRSVPAED